MKIPSTPGRSRHAFTIVELLVALALVLFIMSIISQVFVDTSEAFRSQRAKAELSEKLRFITQTLRADLRANHFEHNRRLSDDDFWADGPPKIGYFRLEQANPYATESSMIPSEKTYISDASSGTVMAFTSFLQGNDQRGFHSVTFPNGPLYTTFLTNFLPWKNTNLAPGDTRFEGSSITYNTPNAEIAWFIDPSRSPLPIVLQDEPGASPVQLFNLYRKVLPLLPENPLFVDFIDSSNAMPGTSFASSSYEKIVSVIPDKRSTVFNSAFSEDKQNIDVPMRRGMGAYLVNPGAASTWRNTKFDFTLPGAAIPGKVASDGSLSNYLIAENVLSFTVEVLPKGSTQFVPLIVNSSNPSLNPVESGIFDTWCQRKAVDISFPTTNPPDGFTGPMDFYNNWSDVPNGPTKPDSIPRSIMGGVPKVPHFTAIRVTIRLYDTNNALSPSKTTWQATVVEPL